MTLGATVFNLAGQNAVIGNLGFVDDLFVEADDVINVYCQSDANDANTAVYSATLTATLINNDATNFGSFAVHATASGKRKPLPFLVPNARTTVTPSKN